MYCPQCGTESPQDQRFCRSCGANLKVIGKAVALSEAVARSDRGPLPMLKQMMKSVKIEHTTDEISNALEQMNHEITRNFSAAVQIRPLKLERKEELPEQRRENHLVKGTASLFSGIALMIFLYYFSGALVLKIPPEKLAKLPFELEPVLKVIWLLGLMPTLSGLGRIIAGLLIRPTRDRRAETGELPAEAPAPAELAGSVVEHTTELLDREAAVRRASNSDRKVKR
jgi:hypothetical protein